MSFEALLWAKQIEAGGPGRKAVLLVLAEYADEKGSCFPSQTRIAREAEVSTRSVGTYLREFEERGLVRRERRRDADGHRTSDRIYLSLLPEKSASLPETDAPLPETGDAPIGNSFAEEPPENRQREPLTPDKPAQRRYPKTQRDAVWEALVAHVGWRPSTNAERARWNVVVGELLDAGATPEEVAKRSAVFRRRYPRLRLTHNALVHHWSSLAAPSSANEQWIPEWLR